MRFIEMVVVGLMILWQQGLWMPLKQQDSVPLAPKNAAILEGSKAFSKDLMKKYHIPTAAYRHSIIRKKLCLIWKQLICRLY